MHTIHKTHSNESMPQLDKEIIIFPFPRLSNKNGRQDWTGFVDVVYLHQFSKCTIHKHSKFRYSKLVQCI